MTLLKELSLELGIGMTDLKTIIATAPKRYKKYTIPKKSGGDRIIAHPARELKLLQRVIINKLLLDLPVHPAAMAYIRGRNIYQNAEIHKDSSIILKLDFTEFFPSILVKDWKNYVRRNNIKWSKGSDLESVSRILFCGTHGYEPVHLSIGAPSSPMVSNIIMLRIDEEFQSEAESRHLKYTRYADDITISGDNLRNILGMESKVRSTLKRTRSPSLKLNEEKRGLYFKGQKRMVTGLVITPSAKISLGRDRKRMISSLIHKYKYNVIDPEGERVLKGMIGFALANEPDFVGRMGEKYGHDIIQRIKKIDR